MNDFATSTQTISRTGLQGLPQRLVMDGLVGDSVMVEAIAAAKERRVGVVSYLVEYNLVNKILLDAIKKGASDIHFEPYEKFYRVRSARTACCGRWPSRRCLAANWPPGSRSCPAGYRRAPRSPGWAHQDEAVQEPGHRLPCQHLPDAVRRKGRAAYPRPQQRQLGIDALGYEEDQKELYLDASTSPTA
jgi:hypothetical protein